MQVALLEAREHSVSEICLGMITDFSVCPKTDLPLTRGKMRRAICREGGSVTSEIRDVLHALQTVDETRVDGSNKQHERETERGERKVTHERTNRTTPIVPPPGLHICVRPPERHRRCQVLKVTAHIRGVQKTGLWVGARRFSGRCPGSYPLTFARRSASWKQESRDSQLLLAW